MLLLPPGFTVVGLDSDGIDVLERDVTEFIESGLIGVLGVNGNGVTTPAPALVGLSTGGIEVLERDVVVNRLVGDGGMEVLGVFGGVDGEVIIPPPATLGVDETPGAPPKQT